jgi:hypothetical protein
MSLGKWQSLMDEIERARNGQPPSSARFQRPGVPSNGALTDSDEVVETPPEPSVNGDRWVNRGTHFKADMLEMIRKYSFEQRLESRQVVDMALRAFFGGQMNE